MEKNNKKRMGLGKGLGALLSDDKPENVIENVNHQFVDNDDVSNDIPIDEIEANPFQPRTNFDPKALHELKESIQTQGIIQPVTVRRLESGKYQLISGERRLQASKLAGLYRIPAFVREATDQQMLEMGLIENIQRENLNAIEVALAYQRLMMECKLRQDELGERVGKDRATVANYLRLLNLPEIIQNGLKEKKISMGHARALLALDDSEQMELLFDEITKKDLSVRKIEELVRNINLPKKAKPESEEGTKVRYNQVENLLQSVFKSKVSVVANDKSKGEIKISFGSREELDIILEKLKKS